MNYLNSAQYGHKRDKNLPKDENKGRKNYVKMY